MMKRSGKFFLHLKVVPYSNSNRELLLGALVEPLVSSQVMADIHKMC